MKRNFTTLVICGNDIPNFEVGQEVKVATTKIEPLSLRKTINDLEESITANTIVILDSIAEMLNQDMRQKLHNISTAMRIVETFIYV